MPAHCVQIKTLETTDGSSSIARVIVINRDDDNNKNVILKKTETEAHYNDDYPIL